MLVLSMNLALLQRTQEDESSGILFVIIDLCISYGKWSMNEE